MTELVPGKRYRVVFEGEVDCDGDLGITDSAGWSLDFIYSKSLSHSTSIEPLPDPEPEWKLDDICEDADGRKWRYVVLAWLPYPYPSYPLPLDEGADRLDANMQRPLRPIMLDGEYVGGKP